MNHIIVLMLMVTTVLCSVEMYDTPKLEKQPRNIHNIIRGFIRPNGIMFMKQEVKAFFVRPVRYFQPEFSYDHVNGFINIKFDVQPDRGTFSSIYLHDHDYYKLQKLGLQKITVWSKSGTEKEIEINESSFDYYHQCVIFDRDWNNDDFGISFHFKIQNYDFQISKLK